MKRIHYCNECKKYTLKEECCSKKTILKNPPKFSEKDKYAEYRRKAKEKELKERGLL